VQRPISVHARRVATFALDPRLAADTVPLGESSECLLLLMNERRYPWLILVPKRAGVREIYQLTAAERTALLEQSCVLSDALARGFSADKINVAALGNVVPQLHLHHVARFLADPAWPGPVWGHSPREAYAAGELAPITERILHVLGPAFPFVR
jgi:diadenosine tetraphosphate (Ap4A) HIT family hydrolase